MAQAMVIHGGSALEPANMNDVFALAKHAAESKFFGCKTPAEAAMVILGGKDLGFSASQSLRAFAVINGRLAMYSDAMVACILSKSVCEYFEEVESSEDGATWVTKRTGRPEKRFTFTKADAVKAKLWGKAGPWSEYPSNMLSKRAAAFLARKVYPDILLGFYTVEEMRDVAEADRGPRRAEPAPVEYVVTGEPVVEHVAGAFAEAIADAASLDDLTAVAKRIKAASLSSEDRDALAAAYKARASELRGAA